MKAKNVFFDSVANDRGSTIVLVALAITALLSAVALAVDIGMLLTARTSAQRAADAAAMAGAGSLIVAPGDEDRAREVAIDFGGQNYVHGTSVEVLPEDVEVLLDEGKVRVTVHRTADRGSAIGTWFARVFGVDQVDVAAVAAAAVQAGGSATCLKPWAVMDGYKELSDPANDTFDEGTDFYERETTGYGTVPGSDYRNSLDGKSYVEDVGRELVLKPGDPKDAYHPGWYYPWNIPQEDGSPAVGGKKYEQNIVECNNSQIYVDEEYMVETGNMIGPTKHGVEELIAKDPGAKWDEGTNTVVNSAYEVSPRIVNVPVFEPTYDIPNGKKPIKFKNIIGLFLEEMKGNDVVGRIMYVTKGMAALKDGAIGPSIQYVQLVE